MKATLVKLVGLLVVMFAAGFLVIVAGVVLILSMDLVTDAQFDDMVSILKGRTLAPPEVKEEDLEVPREREALEAARNARQVQEELCKKIELEIERKKAELQTARQDARQVITELDKKLKKLTEEAKQFEAAKLAYRDSLASEGLKKLREALENMSEKEAAEMLYDYDITTAVKLLRAFKKNKRGDVLSQILKLDKTRGLPVGRAAQIMKLLEDPAALASADGAVTQKSVQ